MTRSCFGRQSLGTETMSARNPRMLQLILLVTVIGGSLWSFRSDWYQLSQGNTATSVDVYYRNRMPLHSARDQLQSFVASSPFPNSPATSHAIHGQLVPPSVRADPV